MKAVDTNILVRWITNDDPEQAAIAARIMEGPVYVSTTVLVELVWVLKAARYRLDRASIAQILANLVDTATVLVEREDDMRWCIDRLEAGADFADMVHLVGADRASLYVTFDQGVAATAGSRAPVTIETLA